MKIRMRILSTGSFWNPDKIYEGFKDVPLLLFASGFIKGIASSFNINRMDKWR